MARKETASSELKQAFELLMRPKKRVGGLAAPPQKQGAQHEQPALPSKTRTTQWLVTWPRLSILGLPRTEMHTVGSGCRRSKLVTYSYRLLFRGMEANEHVGVRSLRAVTQPPSTDCLDSHMASYETRTPRRSVGLPMGSNCVFFRTKVGSQQTYNAHPPIFPRTKTLVHPDTRLLPRILSSDNHDYLARGWL